MSDNYLDFVGEPTDEVSLKELEALAEQQIKAELKVAKCEQDLEKAKQELKELSEEKLPSVMDSIGIADFKTTSGLKINVKETIRAGITKANKIPAFAWLRENDHGNLIKRTISTAFARGEDEKAQEFATVVAEHGFEFDDKEAVHPQTLGAFVREKLENGEEIPVELLGVIRQRVSKITT